MILLLEQQVCSLESAKKLKELGCPQESLFCWKCWIDNDSSKERIVFKDYVANKYSDIEQNYSAYTVAELGELLPSLIVSPKLAGTWQCWELYKSPQHIIHANTEAECRALMLIFLMEHNLIESKGRNGEK